MNRELFIEYTHDAIRAAVVEDNLLCEIHTEAICGVKTTESLFYGRIKQIRTSVSAAFVDIGLDLNGFLPLNETENLRCGDWLIVQGAAKQSVDSKGLRLTTKLNLAGKWLVLVPHGSGVHVSKKVKDGELRRALEEMAAGVCPPDCGLIVRTASSDTSPEMLREESERLYSQWLEVKTRAAGMVNPGLLSERIALDERLVRDMSSAVLSRIVVNSQQQFERFLKMQEECVITEHTRIEWFEEKQQLLFDAYQLEEKITKALNRNVWLDCGGNLVIESCEAMTVIDVNSGKMVRGRDAEDNALRVNLEAAAEVARQIRLRDIGGVIIVDFIDMKSDENRQILIKALRSAVKSDRAQVQVLGLTKLGLMEITRKRVHTELRKALRVTCPSCGGEGNVTSPKEVARKALMQVRRKVLSGQQGPFVVSLARKASMELSQMTAPDNCTVFSYTREGGRPLDVCIEQIESAEYAPAGAIQLKKVNP